MARESIDHVFTLHQKNQCSGIPDTVWDETGGVQLCHRALTRQVGEIPKRRKGGKLFMRVSTSKPKDKTVQWHHISVVAYRPRGYYWNPRPDLDYRWSPNPESSRPSCELLRGASDWLRCNLKLKVGKPAKLWMGCWVEE